MARPKKIIDAEPEVVETTIETPEPVVAVDEKQKIIDWLRTGRMAMFDRNTRWLADRIEAGEHLQ